MQSLFTNRIFRISILFLLANVLAISVFYLSVTPSDVRSATSPVSNSPTDQLLYTLGGGSPASRGDYVSATDGLNTYFSFFIEVPPGQGNLTVQIWDPDYWNTDTLAQNRDSNEIPDGTGECTNYSVVNPSGTATASTTFGADGSGNACTVTIDQNGNNGAWYTLANVTNPTSGHWEIRVNANRATINNANGTRANAYGFRAYNTSPTGNQEYNVYAPSFVLLGVINASNIRRYYNFYPYVTQGCSVGLNDFDMDANANGNWGSHNLVTRLGTNVLTTTTGFSPNNAWATHQVSTTSSATSAIDYGIWRWVSGIFTFTATGSGPTNYSTQYVMNDLHSVAVMTPTAQPEPNTFRIYFPTNNYTSTIPAKPYLTQSMTLLSGTNPMYVGHQNIWQVTIQAANPTNSIGGITFDSTHLVTANVPVSYTNYNQITYNGNATVSQGSIAISPTVGSTGNVVWNPGSISTGTTATLSYQVMVVPTYTYSSNLVTYTLTGAGTSDGTRANFLDETGNTSQARATYAFGPLCPLQAAARYSPTAVVLSNFSAQSEVPGSLALLGAGIGAAGAIVAVLGLVIARKRFR